MYLYNSTPYPKITLELILSKFSRGIQFFSALMPFFIGIDLRKPIKTILTFFKVQNANMNDVSRCLIRPSAIARISQRN